MIGGDELRDMIEANARAKRNAAEIADLRAALKEASSIARDSIDAIEALYTNMTSAIGDALPTITLARQKIAGWEALATVKK